MAFAAFESLPDSARIWIYRANAPFTDEQEFQINDWLKKFVEQWTAHNVSLLANAEVFHHQFIIVTLDENSSTQASGCSIDSQVRFITQIGNELGVDLFDRLTFDFDVGGKVLSAHKDDVKNLISNGTLHTDHLVYDHLIKTKGDMKDKWLVHLNQSWHQRLI